MKRDRKFYKIPSQASLLKIDQKHDFAGITKKEILLLNNFFFS